MAQALSANEDLTTFQGYDDEDTVARLLHCLKESREAFREWDDLCDVIARRYSLLGAQINELGKFVSDAQFDLFWSSFEIMKPAVYARAPVPAVKPRFSDAKPLYTLTAEVLERTSISTLDETNINDVMIEVRNDLLFTNRGVMWPCYEEKKGRQSISIEHVNRRDFLHDVAQKWSEVGWVAKRSWLTRTQMKKRFKLSGEVLDTIPCASSSSVDDAELIQGKNPHKGKYGVWEVWHRADEQVYWVSENYDKLLDQGEPHLELKGFFPCPRPAYGTLQTDTLIPSPDYLRFVVHFQKIAELTSRIYTLLNSVRMKGFFTGGGDIGDAVEAALNSNDDKIVIPVSSFGDGPPVVWLPLAEVAEAITGLIAARTQLIEDYYQLSGISDIMRGATDANETRGAQQLKAQYGSVRVQDKVKEIQRLAADMCKIVAEIESEHYTQESILEACQMDIKTRKEIKAEVDSITQRGEQELAALAQSAEQMIEQARQQAEMTGEPIPQEMQQQAMQQFEQAQQEISQRIGAELAAANEQIPIESVMELLRDDRARSFGFEVESDSTIMTDELQEKASRNEFLTTVSNSIQALSMLAAQGEQGGTLAGELLKFTLAPYRTGRQLQQAVDSYVEAIPQIAAQMQGEGGEAGLAEANKALADAEMAKAQAATMQAESKAANDQAQMQAKMQQMQMDQQEREGKMQLEIAKLQQKAAMDAMDLEKKQAEIDKIRAETMKLMVDSQIDVSAHNLDEFKSLADIEFRAENEQRSAQQQATENAFRANDSQRNAELSERKQSLDEQRGQPPQV